MKISSCIVVFLFTLSLFVSIYCQDTKAEEAPGAAQDLNSKVEDGASEELRYLKYSDFFKAPRKEVEAKPKRDNFVTKMLAMFGWDEERIGRIAVDILVYLGDLVTRRFIGDNTIMDNEIPEYRSLMSQEGFLGGMKALITKSQDRSKIVKATLLDKSLPQILIDGIRNRTDSSPTGCIQLFLCKVSPLVWRIQDVTALNTIDFSESVSNNLNKWLYNIYEFSPATNEIFGFGKECENKYPGCALIDFEHLF